ncbi:hypothetical protein BFW01_g7404 [Lasiodiplodia theobromae]|nr:hypothetical protein BFW01_g7404 [Lasiodiplodia theobromae]
MAMLEEPHSKPRNYKKAHNDPNAYSWGRIGEHNVVIASLPTSRIGEVSAATTASYMLATFPNIRIGLMVGIGAGVPEAEPDIRLGDVAVSMPEGTSGGVIQYDLGKIKPNGMFERKGALNAPPQALLSALGLIQSEHRLNGHRINEFVNDMLQNHPTLSQPNGKEPAYTRPDAATDRLFDAKYQHKGGENCNECVKGKPLMFKRDEPRKVPSPQVFYGIIASGDKVVKDAAARAAVIKDAGEKCICIEMEAAGLMNTFPCLVIRGICDYADSHKNDEWHSYAAATAAAYARELLENIDVDDVEDTPKASEIVADPRQKPPPATNKVSDNPVTREQLEELRKRVDDLKKLIPNDEKGACI